VLDVVVVPELQLDPSADTLAVGRPKRVDVSVKSIVADVGAGEIGGGGALAAVLWQADPPQSTCNEEPPNRSICLPHTDVNFVLTTNCRDNHVRHRYCCIRVEHYGVHTRTYKVNAI
jgi:hypothetical protein